MKHTPFPRKPAVQWLSSLRIYALAVPAVLLLSAFPGCGHTSRQQTRETPTARVHRLEMPVPPAMLTGDSARAGYAAARYWDTFDFSDSTWTTDSALLVQGFAGYLGLLLQLPLRQSAGYMRDFARRASEGSPVLFARLAELAEHYLYNPNSPYRDEELYIPVLEAVTASPHFDAYAKVRPLYQLGNARKNRPGTAASDFAYTTASEQTGRLSALRSDYILIVFYNPDCPDCGRVKDYIATSPVFNAGIASGHLCILAVYPDADPAPWRKHLSEMPPAWTVGYDKGETIRRKGTYDLRAIPSLYLLDKQKRVILKDAPVERVESRFYGLTGLR